MKVIRNFSNITKSLLELKEQQTLICDALSNQQMYRDLTHSEWESLVHRKLTLTNIITTLENLENDYQVLLDTNKITLKL